MIEEEENVYFHEALAAIKVIFLSNDVLWKLDKICDGKSACSNLSFLLVIKLFAKIITLANSLMPFIIAFLDA